MKPLNITSIDIKNLIAEINTSNNLFIKKIPQSSASFLISTYMLQYGGNVCVFTPNLQIAEKTSQDLGLFLSSKKQNAYNHLNRNNIEVISFPSWDIAPYTTNSFPQELSTKRIESFFKLISNPALKIFVIPIESLLKKTISKTTLEKYTILIRKNMEVDRKDLSNKLLEMGYLTTDLVDEIGCFSNRGSIFDIFPPNTKHPLRVDFFDNEIESIREFDSESQRSIKSLDKFHILPIREEILNDTSINYAGNYLKNLSEIQEKSALPRRRIVEDMQKRIFFPGIEYFFGALSHDTAGIWDYLPQKTACFYFGKNFLEKTIEKYHEQIFTNYTRINQGVNHKDKLLPPPDSLFFSPKEVFSSLSKFKTIDFNLESIYETKTRNYSPSPSNNVIEANSVDPLASTSATHFSSNSATTSFASNLKLSNFKLNIEETNNLRQAIVANTRSGSEMLKPLVSRVNQDFENDIITCIFCHCETQVKRLKDLLSSYELKIVDFTADFSLEALLAPSYTFTPTLYVVQGNLSEGFKIESANLCLLSERDIFGEKALPIISQQKKLRNIISNFSQLNRGEFVVHNKHGIGIFKGISRIEMNEVENDFILVEYENSDKLYLPIHKINSLQKYMGQNGSTPKLDKLGGSSFEKARKKVEENILKVAHKLLELYAARSVAKGISFELLQKEVESFEALFPYQETLEQQSAIEDVYKDMSEPRPMDRLICGDVGYGKTEVAMRAVHLCTLNKKQAIVVVPTTVLALQHYRNFVKRFESTQAKIALLSRLQKPKEQKEILADVINGKIDILIGTHRLLSEDIEFKDAGLLIIDEEHRFGVSHKERLKKLKKNIDVLTMTATPIPRTLHMALTGLRSFSLITTPPVDRLAVKTFHVEFDPKQIKEAISLELDRGGQVFFIHNRVRSIDAMANFITKLVPNAIVSVIHGQMKESEMEASMIKFIEQKANVLCSTALVESGLDIPLANTMLIHHAESFGLAQLYQLRGRIGRSTKSSFCYLITPSGVTISSVAEKRIQALLNHSDLGAGFKIASEDLEMRGAGELLGNSQSGNINAVGFDLYCDLLEKAMHKAQGDSEFVEEIDPEVDLKIPAYIPEDFISDLQTRLRYYKTLSDAVYEDHLYFCIEEMEDKYGSPPQMVHNLLDLMKIRLVLKKLRARSLTFASNRVYVRLERNPVEHFEKILQKIQRKGNPYRWSADERLVISIPSENNKEALQNIKNLLQNLL